MDGQSHTIKRAVTCVYQTSQLSAADGRIHVLYTIEEPRHVGVDLGDGLLLAFDSEVSCGGAEPKKGWVVEILDCNSHPARAYSFYEGKQAVVAMKRLQVTGSSFRQKSLPGKQVDEMSEAAFISARELWDWHRDDSKVALVCARRRR
jgi:hypothetical protein